MKEQKSFLMYFAEMVERYRADRRQLESILPQQSSHMRRILRWLTPNGGTLLLILILALTANAWAEPLLGTASAPGPSANTVNYQGRLADDAGTALDGSYGMSFALYDAPTDGNLVWGPEAHEAVPVTDGLFSVGLGSVTPIPTSTWNGDVYLEVTVGGETLEPRELIRSVPIAGMALTVPDGAIASRQMAPTLARISSTETLTLTSNEPLVIPGTSIELSVPVDSTVMLLATCDAQANQSIDLVICHVYVDGEPLPEVVRSGAPTTGGGTKSRNTVSNNYVFNLSAGSHTIEMRARLYREEGQGKVWGGHTGYSYLVVAQTP